ncbi:MAG: hypothetical protein ACHQ1F_03815 [Spirochaetia bacterium]
MVVLFFSLLGGWALAVINFYLANQALLNTLLVAYGLLLGLSHYTMSSIERFLFTCLKTEDGGAVLRALAGPGGMELVRSVKVKFRFPFISSGVDFLFHAVRRSSLIRLLGKKYRVPHAEIAALLETLQ